MKKRYKAIDYRKQLAFWALQACLLAFILINCSCHDIRLVVGLKLYLYQLFAWFGAGYVFIRALRIQTATVTEAVVLSYAFGAIISLLFYMLFMGMKLGFLLPYVTLAEGLLIACFFFGKKKEQRNYRSDQFGLWACIFFLILFLALTTVTVSFVNTMPNETAGGNGYYIDWPYWAGNNIAFTKSFPSDSFRQIGTPFKYHYFSSILVAQISLCTKVDINQITFYFSGIFGGIILVGAAYYSLSRIVKSRIALVLLMAVLLFTDGTSAAFAMHTSVCSFGFDYGYGFGLLSLGMLADILLHDRFKELLIPSCLMLAMTTGCKGPVGVIVLAAYGIAALSFLLSRHIKRGLISGFAWLSSFLIVFEVFIKSRGTFSSGSGLQYIGGLGLNTIITKATGVADIYNSLTASSGNRGNGLPVKIYSLWLYIYRSNRIVVLLLLLACALLLWDMCRKKGNALLASLVIASICGILLAVYTTQTGNSQMYFMMSMFPPAVMGGAYTLGRMKRRAERRIAARGFYGFASIALLIALGISISQYYMVSHEWYMRGINTQKNKYTYKDYDGFYTDRLDYEAFDWLKTHTGPDCLFAIDSHTDIYGRSNTMMAGVFSQRYLWNESKYCNQEEALRRNAVVEELKSDAQKAVMDMKKENVEYLLERVDPAKAEYGRQTDLLTEVFRNGHYIVYKL